jgi:hypothetical protein
MFSTGFSSGARDGRKIGGGVARHVELGGGVPSGTVEQQDGVARDFLEMEWHGLGVGDGRRERSADATRRTNGAKVALRR